MARTRSDSGLSSGRLGVTHSLRSHGGQLATSTPLGVTPAALLEVSTPPRAGLAPGLQAALQESARVRRRLAEELEREAKGGCYRSWGWLWEKAE